MGVVDLALEFFPRTQEYLVTIECLVKSFKTHDYGYQGPLEPNWMSFLTIHVGCKPFSNLR
jgi:hypothetical protein